ncbi:hypothetical protein H6504_02930 [Candidatus Woesearchaeota archaeon]|nr:hypothetical protein [Candidatus Woesearchaeota archaeon]
MHIADLRRGSLLISIAGLFLMALVLSQYEPELLASSSMGDSTPYLVFGEVVNVGPGVFIVRYDAELRVFSDALVEEGDVVDVRGKTFGSCSLSATDVERHASIIKQID